MVFQVFPSGHQKDDCSKNHVRFIEEVKAPKDEVEYFMGDSHVDLVSYGISVSGARDMKNRPATFFGGL